MAYSLLFIGEKESKLLDTIRQAPWADLGFLCRWADELRGLDQVGAAGRYG